MLIAIKFVEVLRGAPVLLLLNELTLNIQDLKTTKLCPSDILIMRILSLDMKA